jgi:hypothetical protein
LKIIRVNLRFSESTYVHTEYYYVAVIVTEGHTDSPNGSLGHTEKPCEPRNVP